MRTLAQSLHNEYRVRHYSEKLQYDSRLDQVAQTYAQMLAADIAQIGDSAFKYSGSKLGENTFSCKYEATLYRDPESLVKQAINSWYSQKDNFDDYGNRIFSTQ